MSIGGLQDGWIWAVQLQRDFTLLMVQNISLVNILFGILFLELEFGILFGSSSNVNLCYDI